MGEVRGEHEASRLDEMWWRYFYAIFTASHLEFGAKYFTDSVTSAEVQGAEAKLLTPLFRRGASLLSLSVPHAPTPPVPQRNAACAVAASSTLEVARGRTNVLQRDLPVPTYTDPP